MVPLSYKELVMLLSKEEVQKRVLYRGEPISMEEFTWDVDCSTFSSELDKLVFDFNYIHGVTFKTGNECIFKTGSDCTLKTKYGCTFDTSYGCVFDTGDSCIFTTGSDCTFITDDDCTFKTSFKCIFTTGSDCTFITDDDCVFNTGSNCVFSTDDYCTFNTDNSCTFNTGYECTFTTRNSCIFNTGSDCTFKTGDECTIVRKDIFDVLTIIESKEDTVTICPTEVPGYLIGNKHYINGTIVDGVHIITDGILSKVIHQKGDVYKVINYRSDKVTYLVKSGELWSHGDTLAEARESLIYKISDRDTSKYDGYTLETIVSKEEAIQMYITITGACESGVRDYVKSLDEVPDECTISSLIELTTGKYGNDVLSKFFNK